MWPVHTHLCGAPPSHITEMFLAEAVMNVENENADVFTLSVLKNIFCVQGRSARRKKKKKPSPDVCVSFFSLLWLVFFCLTLLSHHVMPSSACWWCYDDCLFWSLWFQLSMEMIAAWFEAIFMLPPKLPLLNPPVTGPLLRLVKMFVSLTGSCLMAQLSGVCSC